MHTGRCAVDVIYASRKECIVEFRIDFEKEILLSAIEDYSYLSH
jgi:hypothetical protein